MKEDNIPRHVCLCYQEVTSPSYTHRWSQSDHDSKRIKEDIDLNASLSRDVFAALGLALMRR